MRNKLLYSLGLVTLLSLLVGSTTFATSNPIPDISINIGGSESGNPNGTSTISILLMITVLSLAPAILMLMTSFTRIIIVLGFTRNALSTQQMPPNQVLIGLALFITLFVMSPTIAEVNKVAVQPYLKGEMTQTEALNEAVVPMKEFMFNHTREKDLLLFIKYSKSEKPKDLNDLSLAVLVPAFVISELKTGFEMGFMIFIPFLIIDMVVSSVLMAMGMMMLPPVMISLPFKILLFILVDGWYLVVKSMLLSFNT